MALETYNPHKKERKQKNKHKRNKLFLFGIFIFVVITILINPGEVKNINLTGKVIMPSISSNSSIPINSTILFESLSLENTFSKIIINIDGNSIIKIDNKKFDLNEENDEIILKNFKGKIYADKNNLKQLNGKAEEIILNKMPISKENGKISISLEKEIRYNKIETSKEIEIKNFEEITEGKVEINDNVIILKSDKISIQNYIGPIILENQKIHFHGNLSRLEIEGKNKNMIFSN